MLLLCVGLSFSKKSSACSIVDMSDEGTGQSIRTTLMKEMLLTLAKCVLALHPWLGTCTGSGTGNAGQHASTSHPCIIDSSSFPL